MVKVGICDDELSMRRMLRLVLERTLELAGMEYEIQEYISGEDFIAKISAGAPDILFLDIEMGGMDGIETARVLRKKEAKTVIIFVTSYPDFVFQGYEVHAFHYILKPYKEKKIAGVMEQALKELDILGERYFTVEQKAKSLRIPLHNTIAFQSERRKVRALVNEESIEFYGKLDEVETELPNYFVRIHNRYLVNMNYVTAVEKDRCICGQNSFPVSRAFKQNLEVAFARGILK